MDEIGSVLLVDDEEEVRKILGRNLQAHRFRVETAENWEEAHSKLMRTKFDVLLIDLHLPGIDGDRYSRTIRQTSLGKKLKIIIFSNEDEEVLAERAIDAGVDGFISKSESLETYIKKLESCLNNAD